MTLITRSFDSFNSWSDFVVPAPNESAIQSFDLRYTNGDHFVSRIGVGPISPVLVRPTPAPTGNYGVVLGGKSRVSPTAGTIGLFDFSRYGATRRAVADPSLRGVDGSSSLGGLPSGRTLVLNGFSMDFGPGNDHQIQRVKVLRDREPNVVRSGFGHHSATVGYMGNFSYVMLPEWATRRANVRRWQGSFREIANAPLDKGPHEISLLMGFAFNFSRGVQNLLRIGIDLAGDDLNVRYTGDSPGQDAEAIVDYLNWSVPLA